MKSLSMLLILSLLVGCVADSALPPHYDTTISIWDNQEVDATGYYWIKEYYEDKPEYRPYIENMFKDGIVTNKEKNDFYDFMSSTEIIQNKYELKKLIDEN